jgi:hypothetical protein
VGNRAGEKTVNDSSSNGAIIGGAVGGVLLIALFSGIALLLCRRRRKRVSDSDFSHHENGFGGSASDFGEDAGGDEPGRDVDLGEIYETTHPNNRPSIPHKSNSSRGATPLVFPMTRETAAPAPHAAMNKPTNDGEAVLGGSNETNASGINTGPLTSSTATTGTSVPRAPWYTVAPPNDYAENGLLNSAEPLVYSGRKTSSAGSPRFPGHPDLPPTAALQGILNGDAPSVDLSLSADWSDEIGSISPPPDAAWLSKDGRGSHQQQ